MNATASNIVCVPTREHGNEKYLILFKPEIFHPPPTRFICVKYNITPWYKQFVCESRTLEPSQIKT